MTFVLGVDASTNAIKTLVVGAGGVVRSEGVSAFETRSLSAGAFTQDARDWWTAFVRATRQATDVLTPAERTRVRSIAIAHQRETFVFTNHAGEPLSEAIVWMDERAKPETESVTSELGAQTLRAVSGKPVCVTPSLYKMRMVLTRLEPGISREQLMALDVHAFLVRHATGEFVTSLASADPLGLIDMQARTWSDALLGAATLGGHNVPTLVGPGDRIAKLLPDVARDLGVPADVMLIAGAGDGQAAGLGAGVVREGQLYLNIGTALVGGTPMEAYRVGDAFRTLYGAAGGFLAEMDLKGGSLSFDWLADRVLGGDSSRRVETLRALELASAALPVGAAGLLFVPYLAGVMNPHWNDDLGGALLGLRADHGAAHLYRAITEGLAFEQRLALEALEAELGAVNYIAVTGGGGQRDTLLQRFADVLGRRLVRTGVPETTALGAAMLAAKEAGLADDAVNAARAWSSEGEVFEPGEDAPAYDRMMREIVRPCFGAIAPTLERLGKMRV